jgi:hypothetical protein
MVVDDVHARPNLRPPMLFLSGLYRRLVHGAGASDLAKAQALLHIGA